MYSDRGNIMLSFISSNTDVESTFGHFLGQVVTQLRSIGLNAERSGRNDILLDGRKISGNAFFLLPKSSIVHGTMLFEVAVKEHCAVYYAGFRLEEIRVP